MCIAGSRRGSGESCYQELAMDVQERRHSQMEHTETDVMKASEITERVKNIIQMKENQIVEIKMDKKEQNMMFMRIFDSSLCHDYDTLLKVRDGSTSEITFRRLSNTDRILLEKLDTSRCRLRQTGRFLTIHKRRRKKLITRSLSQEPGVLDDIFHGLVQCILQRAENWQFNAFTLETVTGGRSLPVLCVHLFHWYGLLQYFNLDVVTVWKLFAFIEEGYHSTNPYHNSIHATDVTQAMHCFLQEEKIKPHLTSLEIMASLIAAVTHDLDHPGVNQPFLVATSNHLAALYQNTSVLENHHWRSAIGCLLDSGVSSELPANVRSELQRHISSLILATDITRQQEFLTRFRDYLSNDSLEMKCAEDRHFILQIALKCADISNPCRPWDISKKWSYKVCEEFFRQGDYERRLNLPITPLCNRHTTSIPKIQAGFFKYVVTPLYMEWHRFLGDGLSISLMKYLRTNQKKWEALINQETIKQTDIEISDLDESKSVISSDEEITANDDSSSIDLLIPATYARTAQMPTLPRRVGLNRIGRRHSVPLSITKPLSLSLRQIPRRESLPNEQIKTKRFFQKLKNQSPLESSLLSLLSLKNSVAESSIVSAIEKPVSAEDLLKTNIASITNTEVSKLSTVLQSDDQFSTQIKQLTRQQTFPSLQWYARTKYTTAEMSQCYTQILIEADNSSSCSTPIKNKSCSNNQCCSPLSLHDLDIYKKKSENTLKISQKLLTIDTKRRGSTLSNTKQKYALSSERRHSIQIVRTDDSFSKHHRKRSFSAQDSDSTHVFYVTLTGSYGNKNVSDVPVVKSKLNLDSNVKLNRYNAKLTVQELRTTLPSKILNQCTLSVKSAYIDQEPRRYSTPLTEYRTMIDHAGRRYTTIPVFSEFSAHKMFFIGSPPDSPPCNHSVSSSSESNDELKKNINDLNNETVISSKRELNCAHEKNSKIVKLSLDAQIKENVDPRTNDDFKILASRKRSQGWARRRGSAPVGLLSKLDDSIPISVPTRIDHSYRCGSIPTDITRHQAGGCNRLTLGLRENNFLALRRASLPQEIALGNLFENVNQTLTSDRESFLINNNNSKNNGINKLFDNSVSGMFSPRRGSVPADISDLRHDMFSIMFRNSINSKSRTRKKILKRRSSGGPEMFTGESSDANDNSTWLKWKKEIKKRDPIPEALVKRRGSLPIEMVAVLHTEFHAKKNIIQAKPNITQ